MCPVTLKRPLTLSGSRSTRLKPSRFLSLQIRRLDPGLIPYSERQSPQGSPDPFQTEPRVCPPVPPGTSGATQPAAEGPQGSHRRPNPDSPDGGNPQTSRGRPSPCGNGWKFPLMSLKHPLPCAFTPNSTVNPPDLSQACRQLREGAPMGDRTVGPAQFSAPEPKNQSGVRQDQGQQHSRGSRHAGPKRPGSEFQLCDFGQVT